MSVIVKTKINEAVGFSIKGEIDQACEVLNTFSLSERQREMVKSILAETVSKSSAECIAQKVQLFTLLTQPVRIQSPSIKLDGCKIKRARINFIGRRFKDHMSLKDNFNTAGMERGIFESKQVDVFCYHDVEKLRSSFTFANNGFQFCALSDELTENIKQFALTPYDETSKSNVSPFATQFIEAWGRKNNLSFDRVVCLGFVYRDTDENADRTKADKPFALAHADFQQSNLSAISECLEKYWKPAMESVLGNLTREQYLNVPIKQIVNLWMPLNQRSTVNGLVVMDTSSIQPSKDLRPINTISPKETCSVNSLAIHANPKQKLVAQETMTISDGVIFNSFITVHSAANILRDAACDEHRRSLEGRFALI